jgi:photosystem II stability/assembly factor-like uncharacterized protein
MLALLALVALAFQATEPDLRGEIETFVGGVGANPNGDLWVVSRDGRAFVSKDRHQTWTEVALPTRQPDEFGMDQDELCAIDFVDSERAVISGSIGEEDSLVLRTVDGGATWLPVQLPEPLAVWDTCLDSDGNLWLTGHPGSVLVTRDGGATFEAVEPPFGEQTCSQVFFESGVRGAASTGAGEIRLTEDGGATWRDVSDPQAEPDDLENSVEELALFGDRFVVVDRECVRTRRLEPRSDWEPLAVAGHAVRSAAACSTGLVALLDDQRIVRFSRELTPADPQGHSLGDHLVQVKATPSVALFDLNARGDIACLDEQGFVHSRMLMPPGSTSWPLQHFDGGAGGPRFGTTDGGLYRSPDGGRTWERRAEAASFGPPFAFEDGSGALVHRNERVAIWHDEARRFEDLTVLQRLNAELQVFRRGSLWIAWGYHYDEDPQNPMVATHTVAVGPQYTALVFGSTDGGRTWTRLLEERGCTIVGSFLGEDDVLSLLLSDETVLSGKLSFHDSPNGTRALTFARGLRGPKLTRGPVWGWIEFVAGERGSLGGSDYFAGTVLQISEDGGRTWIDASTSDGLGTDWPRLEFHRLGSGRWVRTLNTWRQPGSVELWRDGRFEPERSFEAEIRDQLVDAAGRLVLRFWDSQVWALSSDGVEWTRLADQQVPARR